MVDRPEEVARGAEGVVHDQRNAGLARHRREGLEIGDVEARIADGLDVERLRAVVDRAPERLRIVAVDELRRDAEPRQGDLQLVVGAAVEKARGDDVVAGAGDRGERQELRRLTGGDRDRSRAAFERRDALLEDVGGRIHDPGVDIAELLQREEPRAVRRSAKV